MSEFDPPANTMKDEARTAWTLGLVAIILAVFSSCSSGMTLLGALPLGIMATMRARTILGAHEIDAVSEVYAKTANITGLIATIYSLIYLTLIAGIILLYGGAIAMVILSEM